MKPGTITVKAHRMQDVTNVTEDTTTGNDTEKDGIQTILNRGGYGV